MRKFSYNILFMSLLALACNTLPDKQPPAVKTEKADSLTAAETIDTALVFNTYCNGRFNYCVDYPKDILIPQPESENGDGRVFNDKNGHKVLTVFGRSNLDADGNPIKFDDQYDEDVNSTIDSDGNRIIVISYQKLGKDFSVISGHKSGKIYYQKAILKKDAFAYAILEYDESDKTIYNKVSAQLFQSFK